jgi:hypothetical protein
MVVKTLFTILERKGLLMCDEVRIVVTKVKQVLVGKRKQDTEIILERII